MKNHDLLKALTVTGLCFFSCSATAQEESAILVDVVNVDGHTGTLYVGVYDSKESFDTYKNPVAMQVLNLEEKHDSMRVKFNIADGEYVVSAFLDENKNEQMDFTEDGVPVELYGHTGQPNYYGPPLYELAKVSISRAAPVTLPLR